MSRLSDILCDYDPQLQEPLARLWEAASLVLLVLAVWEVVRRLAVRLVEESLTVRAQPSETWPVCGRWLQSKGFQPRTLPTLFGVIGWRRRVGRCPKGCKGSQVAPLDRALGLVPPTNARGWKCSGWAVCWRYLYPMRRPADYYSS